MATVAPGYLLCCPAILLQSHGLPSSLHRHRLAILAEYRLWSAGYIGSVGLLKAISRVVRLLRKTNPDLIYVCDPVLGDDGKLYLPAEMVDLYRTDLLQLASVITPNQFEAEQLTGKQVKTEQEALQACQLLLKQGPSTVVSLSA